MRGGGGIPLGRAGVGEPRTGIIYIYIYIYIIFPIEDSDMRVLNKAAVTWTTFPDRPDPCDS